MGFFKDVEIDVMTLHQQGVSMVNIAVDTGLSLQEVMDIIDGDPDMDLEDPAAYAEMAADLDAEYFGQVF